MISYSSCCNNYKSLDRLPKSHVFGDKGELWKLQGQNEIPGRWSVFSEGMSRSWTRRKLADLYLRHLHRVMVRSLQHTQFSSIWHLLSSKEEDRRLGARLKRQSRISVVLWQSQWKKEPCIKRKTGLLDETSTRFWSYTEWEAKELISNLWTTELNLLWCFRTELTENCISKSKA